MATVQNIYISFLGKKEEPTQHTDVAKRESYSIDVQASDEWVITGRYHENNLWVLELKRIQQIVTKE